MQEDHYSAKEARALPVWARLRRAPWGAGSRRSVLKLKHFVLKLFDSNASCRACERQQTSFPFFSHTRLSLWLLQFPTFLVRSVYIFLVAWLLSLS